MNATGQMLSALLGWSQATFVSELAIDGENAVVTREVDGGLQRISVKMPAIVTVDLRLNEPRYASLPNIMKAKAKPMAMKTPADYRRGCRPASDRAENGGTGGPQGGRQGRLGCRVDCETA